MAKRKKVSKPVKQNKNIAFFTQKRKDINDKFFDIVEKRIKINYKYYIKKGKGSRKALSGKALENALNIKYTKPQKFKELYRTDYKGRRGIKRLAADLEINPRTLRKYIDRGNINTKNDKLFINVERSFEKLAKGKKVKRLKHFTKQFTIHNFTFDNFFKLKDVVFPPGMKGNHKKNEVFYFKAGLYIVFERVKGVSTGGEENINERKDMLYTIQNLPLAHDAPNLIDGHKEFFNIIRDEIKEHPSFKYFRFNYYSVQKIDISK